MSKISNTHGSFPPGVCSLMPNATFYILPKVTTSDSIALGRHGFPVCPQIIDGQETLL